MTDATDERFNDLFGEDTTRQRFDDLFGAPKARVPLDAGIPDGKVGPLGKSLGMSDEAPGTGPFSGIKAFEELRKRPGPSPMDVELFTRREQRKREAEDRVIEMRKKLEAGEDLSAMPQATAVNQLVRGVGHGWDSAMAFMDASRTDFWERHGQATPEEQEEADRLRKVAEDEMKLTPDGGIGWFGAQVGQVAGSLYSSGKQGVKGAIAGGVAGAAAGAPAGGVGAIPGAISGASLGLTGGFLADSYIVNTGSVAQELSDFRGPNAETIDEGTIDLYSHLGGSVMAALDVASFKILGKPFEAPLRRMITHEVVDAIKDQATKSAGRRFTSEYIKGLTAETITETTQQVVQDVTEDLAKQDRSGDLSTMFNDPKRRQQVIDNAVQTAFSTAAGMSVVAAPGGIVAAREDSRPDVPLTETDRASPIPDDLIQAGKNDLADALEAEGTPEVAPQRPGPKPAASGPIRETRVENPVAERLAFEGKVRGVENATGDPNAKNPRSSASGNYQFTDGTWTALGGDLAKKNDPAEQERLFKKLTDQNQAGLESAGIPVTAGNLYLAHFAGLGGAKALHANPNGTVESILGKKVVEANPFLAGKTGREVIEWASRKMGGDPGKFALNMIGTEEGNTRAGDLEGMIEYPDESTIDSVKKATGVDVLAEDAPEVDDFKKGERIDVTVGKRTESGVVEEVYGEGDEKGVRIRNDDGTTFDEVVSRARQYGARFTRPATDQVKAPIEPGKAEFKGDDYRGKRAGGPGESYYQPAGIEPEGPGREAIKAYNAKKTGFTIGDGPEGREYALGYEAGLKGKAPEGWETSSYQNAYRDAQGKLSSDRIKGGTEDPMNAAAILRGIRSSSENIHPGNIEWAEKHGYAEGGKLTERGEAKLKGLDAYDKIKGEEVDDQYTAFSEDSGTLGIPRDKMPQIKAEHRGALVNFLNARGIRHEEVTGPAANLNPTQAEFEPAKVDKARRFEGGDRAILVSEEGNIVDGHHQWLAAMQKGEDIRAIVLKKPIREVLDAAHAFPSSETAGEQQSSKSDATEQEDTSTDADERPAFERVKRAFEVNETDKQVEVTGATPEMVKRIEEATGAKGVKRADGAVIFPKKAASKIHKFRQDEHTERLSAEVKKDRQKLLDDNADKDFSKAGTPIPALRKGRQDLLAQYKVDHNADEMRASLETYGIAMLPSSRVYRIEEKNGEWVINEWRDDALPWEYGGGKGYTRAQAIDKIVQFYFGHNVAFKLEAPGKGQYDRPFRLVVVEDPDGRFYFDSNLSYANGGGSGPSGGSYNPGDRFKTMQAAKVAGLNAVWNAWQHHVDRNYDEGEKKRDNATWNKVKELINANLPTPRSISDDESKRDMQHRIDEGFKTLAYYVTGKHDIGKLPKNVLNINYIEGYPGGDGPTKNAYQQSVIRDLKNFRERFGGEPTLPDGFEAPRPGGAYASAPAEPTAAPAVEEPEAPPKPPAPAAAPPSRPVTSKDDVKMRDWSGVTIPDYSEQGLRGDYDGGPTKDAFLKDAKTFAKAVETVLTARGFVAPEPKAARRGGTPKAVPAVSVNEAGPASSGDVYLHMRRADGSGVMMQIGTALAGPNGGISVMARSQFNGGQDGTNRWLDVTMNAADMGEMLAKIADERARAEPSASPKEMGAKDFAAGKQRLAPAGLATADMAEWYKGWDEANLAEPLGEGLDQFGLPVQREEKADMVEVFFGVFDTKEKADADAAKFNASNTQEGVSYFVKQDGKNWAVYREQPKPAEGTVTKVAGADEGKPSTKPSYGANNKLVSRERADEIRAKLKDKLRNQINSGIDPEMLALGTELAVFHIEAGARKFADFARAVATDLGSSIKDLKPFLRGWYLGAQAMIEDSGGDVEGMDGPGAVRAALAMIEDEPSNTTSDNDIGAGDAEPTIEAGTQEPDRGGDADERAPDVSGVEGQGRTGEGAERPSRPGADELRDSGIAGEREGALGEPQPDAQRGGERDDAGAERSRAGRTRASRRVRGKPADRGANFTAPAGGLKRTGSWRDTAERNLDIIELVNQLEAENRPATPAEQTKLAQFVGWGAGAIRNELFRHVDRKNMRITEAQWGEWKDTINRARDLLQGEDLATALQSTQYAHYTSEGVVRAIWDGLKRMGFGGGRILEPGMGIGHFFTAAPADMVDASHYTGIELDGFTAKVAKYLLPQENVIHGDFIKQAFPDGFFDAAIGNPPFAATKVMADPAYKRDRFSLHDYFFAKSLDKVRSGGIVAFVTSRYTMDKMGQKARQFIADRADLVGAIRLPQTAFKENAGTEVVTDVLFLQKRAPGAAPGGQAWLDTKQVTVGGEKVAINQYFAEHPEMVLGKHATRRGQFSATDYTVEPYASKGSIEAQFADAVENLPEGIYTEQPHQNAESLTAKTYDRDFAPASTKEGGVYVKDGKVLMVDKGSGVPVEAIYDKLRPAEHAWLKDYVPLRDALKDAQKAQLADDENWEKHLDTLKAKYRAFTKKHGRIKEFTAIERKETNEDGETITRVYRRFKWDKLLFDIEAPLVQSLERITDAGEIVDGPFLRGRTLNKPVRPQIESVADALAVNLDEIGRLDIDYIGGLIGKTHDEVIEELGTLIYRDPSGEWQTADQYLSGDVVQKLEEAESAAVSDPDMERNVEALKAVQPTPLTHENINVKLGAPWIKPSDVAKFAEEVLEAPGVPIRYEPAHATWTVEGANDRWRRYRTTEYGTQERSPLELLDAVLNNRSIKVTKKEDKKEVVDQAATAAANDAAKKISERFRTWLWEDAGRATEYTDIYNRRYNNLAPRRFDGSYLTTPGLSSHYTLFAHQKRAIARIIQTGDTYLNHAVGAGKTLEMIVAGMEQRRLGLVKKPMYVVPNHMLNQFAQEFLEAYPAANIMVADDKAFHTDNRRRFLAQAALNDPDAIILTHSSFGKIDSSDDMKAVVVDRLISELEEAMEEAKQGDAARHTVSKIEKRIEQLKSKFEAKTGTGKDKLLPFDEMGVDFLFIDEAHEFRKLDFATNRAAKGIDSTGSGRALDLFIKSQWLKTRNPTRSLVLASGTPITNTMAELFTVMRYMDLPGMERDNIAAFDAWASMFGEVVAGYEQNAAGGYEIVERFAKFVNVPELMKRARQFMDVLVSEQLGDLVKRPKMKGGLPIQDIAPASPELEAYMKETLLPRLEASRKWKPTPDQPGNPDPVINIITDARLASIDLRFVTLGRKSDPQSKLNRMITRIAETYKRTAPNEYLDRSGNKAPRKGAAQIVFSAVGFGEQVAQNRGFDVKGWIESELVRQGVDKSQIAWMSDANTHAKKEQLQKDIRAGKVRILFGSPKNMGTGLNVQDRLFALHYLSPPWYPADVEQPHGRIIRQGNQHDEVEVNWYATKGTYDSTQWGMVSRKQKFIEQAMIGDDSVRVLEDISEANKYEMAAALAAGDDRLIRVASLAGEITRLENLREAHSRQQVELRSKARQLGERYIPAQKKLVEDMTKASKLVGYGPFQLTANGGTFDKHGEGGQALIDAMQKVIDSNIAIPRTEVGRYRGFPLFIQPTERGSGLELELQVDNFATRIGERFDSLEALDPVGIARRIEGEFQRIPANLRQEQASLAEAEKEYEASAKKVGAPFAEAGQLADAIAERAQLQSEIAGEATNAQQPQQPAPQGQARDVAEPIPAYLVRHDEALKVELQKQLRAFGIADRIALRVGQNLELGEKTWQASYWRRVISVATDAARNPRRALAHESIHAMKALGLFTDTEWKLLTDRAWAKPERKAWVLANYPKLDLDLQREEAAAEEFADYFDMTRAQGEANWLNKMLVRAFQFITAVARSVGKLLNRPDLLQADVNSLMDSIASGKVGRRETGFGEPPRDRAGLFYDAFGNRQRPQYQVISEEPFYSALERAVEGMATKRAPPSMWIATLQKTPGIKKEELDWSGVIDWLQMQDGPVDKDVLLKMVQDNAVVLDERILGEVPQDVVDGMAESKLQDAVRNFEEQYERKNGEFPDDDTVQDFINDNAELIRDRVFEDTKRDFDTQYEGYSSDESNATYREMLITLPLGEKGNPERAPATHWDWEGVVAHTRFMDKPAADGSAILFVEEIQSDWHQKGRERGYEVETKPAEKERLDQASREAGAAAANARIDFWRKLEEIRKKLAEQGLIKDTGLGFIVPKVEPLLDKDGFSLHTVQDTDRMASERFLGAFGGVDLSSVLTLMGEARELYDRRNEAVLRDTEAYQARINAARGGGIPDAPFKKTWPALVMKRLIRYAAENGYQRIAWTTGDEQAERYRLDFLADGISYKRNENGTWRLSVQAHGRPSRMIEEEATAPQLREILGSELAQKVIDGHGNDVNFGANNRPVDIWKQLSAEDLRVGGEGMRAFYDRNLVNITNDIIKKYGGKVGTVQIAGVEDRGAVSGEAVLRQQGMTNQAEIDRTWRNMTQDERDQAFRDYRARNTDQVVDNHSFEITPELRAAAMGGQPMFSVVGTPTPAEPDFGGDTEKRWQEARKGVGHGSPVEKAKAWWEDLAAGFSRHWRALPNQPRFADVQQQLRKLEAAPDAAMEASVRHLKKIVGSLSTKEYDLFSRKVVLDDLSWDAAEGRDLPFGFTPSTLLDARREIDAQINLNPKLVRSIRERKTHNQRIADEMVASGVLTRDQIKNPSYFRHMVLEYARAEAALARSPTKVKSPYWAKRMGSSLDINANLLEAELDWMMKAQVDIQTAKTIEWIKASPLNVRQSLRDQAKAHNKAALAAELASNPSARKEDGWFRSNIARGLKIVQDELTAGHLDPIPAHLQQAADDLANGVRDGEAPFALMAWILDGSKAGAMGAGMVLKYSGLRKQWMRKLLDDDYHDPEDIAGLVKLYRPDGMVAWQPKEGKHLFTAKTITEHALDMFVSRLADTAAPGLDRAELAAALGAVRQQLVVGGDRYTMVIPEELGATLDEFGDRRGEGMVAQIFGGIQSAWKRWVLINPRRFFKYNINNMTGDLDAIIAGNPHALTKVPTAWRLLRDASKGKIDPRYQDALDRGVFTSGLSAQEIPDINRFSDFRHLTEGKSIRPDKLFINGIAKLWRVLQDTTNFREQLFRLAAYIDYDEKIEAGIPQVKIGYGASVPNMVEAVTDPKDRAALLARDLVGDYGSISVAGGWLRRYLIPFWSWTEINGKRYWRLTANTYRTSKARGIATGGLLGAGVAARTAVSLYIRMGLVYGLLYMWNHMLFPDEEDDLSDEQRKQLHLILGRDQDGNVVTLRTQGALSDVLGFIGFTDLWAGLDKWQDGQGSIGQAFLDMAKAPVNRVATSTTPLISVPIEQMLGQETWPDIFNPRRIHDRWRHLFSTFSLEHEYDQVADKPTRGYARSWTESVVYKRDPDEMAYDEAKGIAYDWLDRVKGQEGGGFSSARGEALRDYRLGLRYGDREAADKALIRYSELGGTEKSLKQSIAKQHPLGPIAKKDRAAFLDSLTDEQLDIFAKAEVYWERTYANPEG